jgi:3-deoxy-D-manno-octulosonic-acid transferase
MGSLIYSLGLFLYKLAIWVASFFSKKANDRWEGAKSWRQQLAGFTGKKVIWMHCASLGEFEQGRPVLEALHLEYPDREIVLSFYSPSGYRIRKNYDKVARVIYLPEDGPKVAREFVTALQPSLVFFVKYDLWFYFLKEIQKRKIPAFLIAAKYNAQQKYFIPLLRPFYLNLLSCFTLIFTQDHESYTFLSSLPELKGKVKVAGDPRFDRVIQQVQHPIPIPDLSEFLQGEFCVIAGSTWPKDDLILLSTIRELKDHRIRWIIAPHEFTESTAQVYKKAFPSQVILFSEIENLHPGHKLLLIDRVGYLSSLYQYGSMAYIGGGQHHRIHNIQEPAAWGLPLAFGPRHRDFQEAVDILKMGGAVEVQSVSDLLKFIEFIKTNTEKSDRIRNQNRNYIQSKAGATGRILSLLQAAQYLN